MLISRFFLGVLCVMGWIILEPMMAISAKLPCRLRNSNYCKNPKYFKKDLKDGCGGPRSNCRQKFCQKNCFGETAPEKSTESESIYRLCQVNCDPEEMPQLGRQERQIFNERFLDLAVQRHKEAADEARRIQISLFDKCNDRCKYTCNAVELNQQTGKLFCADKELSCKTKMIKNGDPEIWADCAKDCFFLSDIKAHAEQCAGQPVPRERPVPRPRTRRQ